MGAFTQEMGKIPQLDTLSGGLFLGERPGEVQDSLAGFVILGIISIRRGAYRLRYTIEPESGRHVMLVDEMTLEECYRALRSTHLGRLGCAHADQPYVVPIFFASDGTHLYSSNIYCFSTIGLKIEWMRANPLVCLEIDDVKNTGDWMSVVVLGHYQELLDTAEYEVTRRHAYDLLSERALWWEPAAVPGGHGDNDQSFNPVYYRIFIDHLTGRRGVAEPRER